jgi:Type VI secretion system/phage-baseplate injector OB domain
MNTERIVAGLVERVERRYFGKYRGFVVDNDDPKHLGRLRLRVPSVLGDAVVTGWALPCVPYGGAARQGLLFVPDPKAGVWVEFEEGDLEFPIWVGTFWSAPGGQSELPVPNGPDGTPAAAAQAPPTRKILTTAKGHTLQFEDADHKEAITLVDGVNKHVVQLDAHGITITDGVNAGNKVVLAKSGITISDSHGNQVSTTSDGIQLGDGKSEPMVLGSSFAKAMDVLVKALSAHVHPTTTPGNPTGPPAPPPLQLKVPLSTRQTVA